MRMNRLLFHSRWGWSCTKQTLRCTSDNRKSLFCAFQADVITASSDGMMPWCQDGCLLCRSQRRGAVAKGFPCPFHVCIILSRRDLHISLPVGLRKPCTCRIHREIKHSDAIPVEVAPGMHPAVFDFAVSFRGASTA